MAQLATLEAKMASIEVSLSSNTPRRRKGTSLGGGSSVSARASPRPPPQSAAMSVAPTPSQDIHNHNHLHQHHLQQPQQHPAKELRTALQDREAVIQNLRLQLGLGKMPRPQGNAPLEDAERPAAEQQLARLKHDADIKRVQIRNLKLALDKLDITDNIDARIRQAELEYALGREELQMLSLVEEARALQTRMDKTRPEANSLFSTIQAGTQLCLQAVQATVGRWAACAKANSPGMWIEWAKDGEGLYRGDRILEVNGSILMCKTREELHKLIGVSGRVQLVVVRKRVAPVQQQQLVQSQEDNQRLQHRICYLEDQVKELLAVKDHQSQHTSPALSAHSGSAMNNGAAHVTSISISSGQATSTSTSPPSPLNGGGNNTADKPQIYQRGNYVTTIIGGKPSVDENGVGQPKSHITKTTIINKDGVTSSNGHHPNKSLIDTSTRMGQSRALSASKISINSDSTHIKRDRHREARRLDEHQPHQAPRPGGERERRHHQHQLLSEYGCHNGTDTESQTGGGGSQQVSAKTSQYGSQHRHRSGRHSEGGSAAMHYHGFSSYARSVEQLNLANGNSERRKDERLLLSAANNGQHRHHRMASDMRSVKSLDFDSDAGGGGAECKRDVDYTSEPVPQHRIRPTPPKKPLRLSLQRAQSLQTVEANLSELDRKRAMKRTHKGKSSEMLQFIENNLPFHTSSLGRNNYV